MPGWCFVCSISGPADASAARCLDELAMLAAGQKLMPAMTLDPGLPAQLTRCERLLSGAPVLPLLQGRLVSPCLRCLPLCCRNWQDAARSAGLPPLAAVTL
jgi:hypothetical protein